MVENTESAWSIFKLNLTRMPWRDFSVGMLIPLLLLEFVSVRAVPLLGLYCSVGWLVIVMVIIGLRTRALSVFPAITLICTVTNVAGCYLVHVNPVFVLTPSLDATIIGLVFVGSMLRPRPFVMKLVDKKTIELTYAKFGKSKYFYKAWFDVNIIWGIFYITQGVVISYLMILNVEAGNIMNLLFSWPSVLVLLYISVDYPRRYWTKHWAKMQQEIEAAQLYEKGYVAQPLQIVH
jgi:hypothetical protein